METVSGQRGNVWNDCYSKINKRLCIFVYNIANICHNLSVE